MCASESGFGSFQLEFRFNAKKPELVSDSSGGFCLEEKKTGFLHNVGNSDNQSLLSVKSA